MVYRVSKEIAALVARVASPPICLGMTRVTASIARFGFEREEHYIGLCSADEMDHEMRRRQIAIERYEHVPPCLCCGRMRGFDE